MKYEQLCKEILPLVGGRENIKDCFNCMTRLRMVLAEPEKADLDALKKVEGVLGINVVGSQLQCIVGQKAGAVCKEFCEVAGIEQGAAVKDAALAKEDMQEREKKPLSIKDIPSRILDVMANVISPVLPVIICASMFKLMSSLFGPSLLDLIHAESDLNTLLTFVGDVPFYFLPVLIGYSAAKYFGVSIPLGIVMGGVLLHPTLIDIVKAGEAFAVYGIPMRLVNYSKSIIPVLLCVWIMSYVEKFFQKHLPDMLKFMLVNFLTLAVMLPLGLCVLAPAGNIIATAISNLLVAIPQCLGAFGVGIVCFLWPLLVATGMHTPVAMIALNTFTTVGHEDVCLVADNLQHYAAMGVALAFAYLATKKEDKTLGTSSFVSMFLGGVIEPTIFGIAFPYKKFLLAMLISNGLAGLFAGAMHVGAYTLGSTNIFGLLFYTGSTTSNLVCGLIAAAISFASAFIISVVLNKAFKNKNTIA